MLFRSQLIIFGLQRTAGPYRRATCDGSELAHTPGHATKQAICRGTLFERELAMKVSFISSLDAPSLSRGPGEVVEVTYAHALGD